MSKAWEQFPEPASQVATMVAMEPVLPVAPVVLMEPALPVELPPILYYGTKSEHCSFSGRKNI